jgi:hypothetical protein
MACAPIAPAPALPLRFPKAALAAAIDCASPSPIKEHIIGAPEEVREHEVVKSPRSAETCAVAIEAPETFGKAASSAVMNSGCLTYSSFACLVHDSMYEEYHWHGRSARSLFVTISSKNCRDRAVVFWNYGVTRN